MGGIVQHSLQSNGNLVAGTSFTTNPCRSNHKALRTDRLFATTAGHTSNLLLVLEAIVGAGVAADFDGLGTRNKLCST